MDYEPWQTPLNKALGMKGAKKKSKRKDSSLSQQNETESVWQKGTGKKGRKRKDPKSKPKE